MYQFVAKRKAQFARGTHEMEVRFPLTDPQRPLVMPTVALVTPCCETEARRTRFVHHPGTDQKSRMNVREHLLAICLGLVLPTIAVIGPPAVAADSGMKTDETARTAAAVMTVDQHWNTGAAAQ